VLENLLSIEDFEKQHLARTAARSAAQAQAKASSSTSQPVPQPILTSTRSSANTQLFVQLCQRLTVPYSFDFSGDASKPSWAAILTVNLPEGTQRVLKTLEIYTSKKEAKEAASTLGVSFVSELEAAGTLSTPVQEKAALEDGENYIGILLEFAQSIAAPQPTYTEFKSGTAFSAELDLSTHHPGAPFGGRTVLFSSKKLARAAAAKEAVTWLRERGELPAAGTPIRKRKPRASSAGLNPSPGLPDDRSGIVQTSSGISAAARVLNLANELGLPQPVYQYAEPNAMVPRLFTVSCVFPGGGIGTGGDGCVAMARHVLGKKAAREECARLAAGELERVLVERKGDMERVMGAKKDEDEDEDEVFHDC
jgi:hypothetical protein